MYTRPRRQKPTTAFENLLNLTTPIVGYDELEMAIYDLANDTILDDLDHAEDLPPDTDEVHMEFAQGLFVLPDQSAGKLVLDFKLDPVLKREVARILKPGGTVEAGRKKPEYKAPPEPKKRTRRKSVPVDRA